jgi:hypothetical protein
MSRGLLAGGNLPISVEHLLGYRDIPLIPTTLAGIAENVWLRVAGIAWIGRLS